MSLNRRGALKRMVSLTAAAAATATPGSAAASTPRTAPADAVGMLYDTTLCIGCKACVVACNAANGLRPDPGYSDGRYQAPLSLNASTKNIIKRVDDDAGPAAFVKVQCMHCVDPACANACMLGALKKREFGIVSYDVSLCVGCRYCQMACPFNVPAFEWEKALTPKIVKCELCRHRLAVGREPACTEVCPRKAVIFGRRSDLLAEAHRRLAASPGRYVPRVYGETEAGGTQVLYLSHVPFERIGLPAYGPTAVPEPQRSLQHRLYGGFVAPVVLYGVLAALVLRNRTASDAPRGEEQP